MRVAVPISSKALKEPWSLRGWVFAVAAVSLAAAILASGLAGWYSWYQQKQQLGQSLVAATRAIIESTDHELGQAIALAGGLAVATSIKRGDLASFERRMRSLIEPFGYFLIVSEPGSAKELLNTALPLGSSLPEMPAEWAPPANMLLGPSVRPLIRRPFDGAWTTAVQMPATDANGRKYVITIGVPSERFQQIIDEQRLPAEWSTVILDLDWTIVARGIRPEKYIGAKGANAYLKNLPSADSTYEGHVLDGYASINARSRSDKFGWTAAVAVPQSLLLRQFFGPAALAALGGFSVSILALAALGLLASRLVQDVRVLSKAVEKLSNRHMVVSAPMSVKELQIIADGLEHASERLKAEEQFRKRAVDELAHRLRNKVATIQAIIYSQLRAHPAPREAISNCLRALATTDELLIKAHGEGAGLEAILGAELAPYDPSRLTAVGPQVALEPNLAFTMALLFHELATNAAKYGALSNPQGRVEVNWSITGNRLELEWREAGGPPVQRAERRGFGTQLVISALGAFGGQAQANFEPSGLVVRMHIDLAHRGMRIVDQEGSAIREVAV